MIERGTKKYLPNQDRKIRKAKKEKKKNLNTKVKHINSCPLY